MEEQSRKRSAAVFAAAAVLTAGGAWFGAGFYRNAPRERIAAEIVHREPVLPEITAEGLAAEADAPEEADSVFDPSSEDSGTESSRPEDGTEDRTHESAAPVTVTDSSSADTSEARQQAGGSSFAPVQGSPDADSPAPTVSDGREADREYFTTSIKDGETAEDSIYFFTVTHLIDSLELIRCDVEVNGTLQGDFAGRCRLSQGGNTIRVSCTYKDAEGRIYRAFRDYTVYLESIGAAIVTDLTDCVVYEPRLVFGAECADGLEVRLNGLPIEGDGNYAVDLTEGDNVITLTSGSNELSFTVIYIPAAGLDIITDLSDCTVYGGEITFAARAVGGGKPSLTVQVDGKTLRGRDGVYTASLSEGANSIRLLAKDGSDRAERTFTVISLPEYDVTKLPRLGSINLKDNMTLKGSAYTLSLRAEDCGGGRIWSGNIEVTCDGRSVGLLREDAAETAYLLKLNGGENSVYIRLTDSAGRQSEFSYTILCEETAVGEEIGRIAISIGADVLGLGVLCADDSYPVLEGETGFDTVERFLRESGFEVESSGSGRSRYLARISMPGRFASAAPTEAELAHLERNGIAVNNGGDPDSLGEFDYTLGSGWIFRIGGRKVSYAISSAAFADGDSAELIFSLDMGNDTEVLG